jgi:hypothetical protein
LTAAVTRKRAFAVTAMERQVPEPRLAGPTLPTTGIPDTGTSSKEGKFRRSRRGSNDSGSTRRERAQTKTPGEEPGVFRVR